MSEEARDSGICVDNDDDSYSTSLFNDFNQLSYVQRLRKRFECLAKEQEKEFHSECNWWLQEEGEEVKLIDTHEKCPRHDEEKSNEATNKIFFRNISSESEKKVYSKQSSIKSQISQEGIAKVAVTPLTPVKTPTPQEYSILTFTDYEVNNETNDSDCFDSDDGDEEIDKSIEVEPELPSQCIRNSRQSLKLIRPISITSQTSK